MRLHSFWFFPLLLLASASSAYAEDRDALVGVWWRTRNRITVNDTLFLDKPLVLTADEIVIRRPIITNGFALDIEARRLVFEETGRIESFSAPAKTVETEAPTHATRAATGAGDGGQGAGGEAGKPGFDGIAGMGVEGGFPSEISIFAGDVVGTPIVDGHGQAGGKGGKGGAGQDGGQGGKGRNARARMVGSNRKAGQGGRGGPCGAQGKGGRGGKGGVPVPVTFLLARDWREKETQKGITSTAGAPGRGGEPGALGEAGTGGPGGDGDKAKVGFVTTTEGGGPAGGRGACTDETQHSDPTTRDAFLKSVTGDPGADGESPSAIDWWLKIRRYSPLVIRTFADFEERRRELVANWFEYHWWRLFELVSRTSLQLILPSEKQAEDRALGELLGGELDIANLEVVAERWTKGLLEPLKRRAEQLASVDPKLEARVKRVIAIVEPYVVLLNAAKKRGAIHAEDAKQLEAGVKKITETRRQSLNAALEGCLDYVTNVFGSEDYRSLLAKRQTYFEVPICRTLETMLGENGLKHPIQLVSDFAIPSALREIPQLVLEMELPQGPPPGKRETELSALHDAVQVSSTKVVPRGYVFPKKRPSIENLAAFLASLARSL